MKYFAQLDDGLVVNTIVTADDFSHPEYLEYTTDNPACIGGPYLDKYFYTQRPFASWMPHEGEWIPPVPMPPEGLWIWSEDTQEWLEIKA